jgi:hypothetical protein
VKVKGMLELKGESEGVFGVRGCVALGVVQAVGALVGLT